MLRLLRDGLISVHFYRLTLLLFVLNGQLCVYACDGIHRCDHVRGSSIPCCASGVHFSFASHKRRINAVWGMGGHGVKPYCTIAACPCVEGPHVAVSAAASRAHAHTHPHAVTLVMPFACFPSFAKSMMTYH